MRKTDTPTHITPTRLRALASSYLSHLPPKLLDLEASRLHSIPQALQARKQKTQQANVKGKGKEAPRRPHLTHPDLITLVTWKLTRGKFRPALAGMIRGLRAAEVEDVTGRALEAYDCEEEEEEEGKKDHDKRRGEALAILTQLRGVGPATASLILSVYDRVHVPFFSDELCVWLASGGAGGDGGRDDQEEVAPWPGPIKYTAKEYTLLCERLHGLTERLVREEREEGEGERQGEGEEIGALEVEHAAYLIVKGLANGDDGDGTKVLEAGDAKMEVKAKAAAKNKRRRNATSEDEPLVENAMPANGRATGNLKRAKRSRR